MSFIIYIRRISRHVKEEYNREFRKRITELQSSRGIFSRSKRKVWRRR